LAVLSKPDAPVFHYNYGVALAASKRDFEAIEQYAQALNLKSDYLDAYNNLGVLLAKTGRLQDAIEQYNKALRLNPNYVMALSNLAVAYYKAKQPAEAVAAAQKAVELAREQGKTDMAEQLEKWLKSHSSVPNQ
jgi:tetratricopeptide (TPR) repeat protein